MLEDVLLAWAPFFVQSATLQHHVIDATASASMHSCSGCRFIFRSMQRAVLHISSNFLVINIAFGPSSLNNVPKHFGAQCDNDAQCRENQSASSAWSYSTEVCPV